MLTESEQQALKKLRFYIQAGHSLTTIRESGWEEWIAHFEKKGVSLGDPEPLESSRPVNAVEEPTEETDTSHRQPAMQGGTQDVALDQIAAPAIPSPDPTFAKASAFAALGFPGLSPTKDLRRAGERARVKQKMARDSQPDATAGCLDRLVSDPVYRVREAAAWYFSFGVADDAAIDRAVLGAHDAALARWHSFMSALHEGSYDADLFAAACEASAGLFAGDAAWQPLSALAEDIADVRLGRADVLSAAEAGVERWTCAALFAIAATGNAEDTRSAADIKDGVDYGADLVDEFGGAVDAAIEATVLKKAAEELSHIAAAHEAQAQGLLEQIETDDSTADALVDEAEELVKASRPWWELVDVFDEDPDSGEEGHALNRVAELLKSVAVSLANHAQDFGRALQSLKYAHEIAQSRALKLSLEGDLKLVRYLEASAKFMEAVKAGRTEEARRQFAAMEIVATTDEQRQTVATLRPQVQQLAQAKASSGGGGRPLLGWIIIFGIFGIFLVIAMIIVAIQGDDEGSPPGSSAPSRNVPAAGSSGSSSSGFSSQDAEGRAIDVERARLEREAGDLESLSSQIGSLGRRLENTERLYPNGAPDYIIDQYEADRLRHNRLVAQYNDMLDEYQTDEDAFNRRVAAYNSR